MIELIETVDRARARLSGFRDDGSSIGFVPTMGALHDGHLSLIERARAENDRVVVSIFVNPTQYDDPADLERYPRTLAADLEKAQGAGADLVIPPRFEYPSDFAGGLAGVPLEGKGWGFIDPAGKVVIPPRFSWVYGGFRQ